MKICFPVSQDKGLNSKVYGHFGSAPLFIFIETKDDNIAMISNKDASHVHGQCKPLKALDNQKVDAMIVAGIGAGALSKLNKSGIKVFHARAETVKKNLELFKAQNLAEFKIKDCCTGHHRLKSLCKHY